MRFIIYSKDDTILSETKDYEHHKFLESLYSDLEPKTLVLKDNQDTPKFYSKRNKV